MDNELFNLAKAMTMNEEIAKELADKAQSSDDPTWDICCDCVDWLCEQDESLFKNPGSYDPLKPCMSSLEDVKELSTLSTEERVVVLLRVYEEFDMEDTMEILGIEEDAINAYLQSAYENNHPAPPVALEPEEEEEPDVKRRIAFNTQHMFLLLSFAMIIVAVVVAIGAIQRYAATLYEEGIACMQMGQYEEANAKFTRASRYGDKHEDLDHWLGESFYSLGEYEKALKYLVKTDQDSLYMACYEQLVNEAIAKGDTDNAISILEKVYAMQEDYRTVVRLGALRNAGAYEDPSGIIYNVYGDPICLSIHDDTISLKGYVTYGENRIFAKFNDLSYAYDSSAKVFVKFKTDGVSIHTVYFREGTYPTGESIDKEEIVYENTIENSLLQKRKVIKGDMIYNEYYIYEDQRLARIACDNSEIPDIIFSYDEYGNLAKKTQGDDITLYRYNAQGLLSEKTAPNGDTVSYGYCADGTPWRYETSDFFGKPKEIGFYNPVCGWIAIALD